MLARNFANADMEKLSDTQIFVSFTFISPLGICFLLIPEFCCTLSLDLHGHNRVGHISVVFANTSPNEGTCLVQD